MADKNHLNVFASLDDADIMSAIKVWAGCDDKILSLLCQSLIDRCLYHVDISIKPASQHKVDALIKQAVKKYRINEDEASYFVFTDSIRNNAYRVGDGNIRILMKDNSIKDITDASDYSSLGALTKTVKKQITGYNKDLK